MPKADALVDRYTIDNRYNDAVLILLKAPLAHSRHKFTDMPDDWGDEELLVGRPDEMIELLAVPHGGPVDADLQPGRVFLRGRFEVAGPASNPTGFEAAADLPQSWMRIDRLPLVKEAVKQLYSDLLTAGGSSE